MCFQSLSFDVQYLLRKDEDVIQSRIHLEEVDAGQYPRNFYDAVLRKVIEVPVTAEALESKMRLIDLGQIAEHAEKIEAVVAELDSLAGDTDCKKTAELLRYKYSADTTAEDLVPNLLAF